MGDSRFYRYSEGELIQLTHDHTYLGSQYRAGNINERELRMHPNRNILNQAIGGRCQRVHPQVESTSVLAGDWFLICSDGIIDGLWNKNIEQIFEEANENGWSPAETQKKLLDRAFHEAGLDDTTLFVIQVS